MATKTKDGLTDYQRRFLAEFLIDFHATNALRRMDPTGENHRQRAFALKNVPAVREAIDANLEKMHQKNEVTGEKIIAELALLGFSNVQDFIQYDEDGNETIDITRIPRERAAAIAKFKGRLKKDENGKQVFRTVEIDLHPKLQALHRLGIHKGIFKEDAQVAVPVVFEIHGAPPIKGE